MAETLAPDSGVVFALEKIYTKDASFEAPNSPRVFVEPTQPSVGVELGISHGVVNAADGLYEVVLSVTVTAKAKEVSVFLAEVHQAGLFRVRGVGASELPQVLEIACPNILLPFARQMVTSLVESGGFPQLLINPVNFESLYQQKQAAPTGKPQ